ncbi:MAG: DNA-directed RNA polymerase subunit alpha [Planctomycetes bacterium]|nr:DNA-directed RNA polymerase subunit alpha [Planctomycetota bacterium]
MRVRWREFELPTQVIQDDKRKSSTYGCFIAEPFERGFGNTIANPFRRILLSSIEGAAVTSVRIKGVEHEFSTIDGVTEDVTAIILNLKKLIVRLNTDEPRKLSLNVKRIGAVTAADFTPDPMVEIINPDLHIATLVDEQEFTAELTVKKGRGYVRAEENVPLEEHEIGVIPLDSIFSPVTRVNYHIENTRVGRRTDYDKLVLEIWTNGTVTPEMALVEAAKIYRKHLNPFVQYFELGKEIQLDEKHEVETKKHEEYIVELKKKLAMPIGELDLSVRGLNCFKDEKIHTIKDIVVRAEADMLKIRNFGKTSLKEVKKKLSEMGLSLGMDLETLVGGKGK